MADQPYLPTPDPLARWTRKQILDHASTMTGLKFSSLSAQEQGVVLQYLDARQNLARKQLPLRIQGFAEAQVDLTFDPAANTRIELPLDFDTLYSGGRIFLLDEDDNVTDQVDVTDPQEYRESIEFGFARHDSRLQFLALPERMSDQYRRFITFIPIPESTIKVRIPYLRRTQRLTSDSSILEAPLDVHMWLANKMAAFVLKMKGNQRHVEFTDEANEIWMALSGAQANEKHQVVRFVSFDKQAEKRGYARANYPE